MHRSGGWRGAGRWLAATLAAVSLALPAGVAWAQAVPVAGGAFCLPGEAPRFQLGFAALKERLGASMGLPLECEHGDSASRDTLQRTTAGLAFYRARTNTPTFTDGHRHWALTEAGLLYWEGAAVDPPLDARRVPAPSRPRPFIPVSGPSSFVFPVLPAPPGEAGLPCLPANPSCRREAWWAEWNELQWDDLVQFEFLGPGLVAEYRFAQAVWLLWQWSEGQFLLREGAAHGVAIFSAPFAAANFADYAPVQRVIHISPDFTSTSTWMLADLLAHELKHAADSRAGVLASRSYADCIAREQSAYAVEHRFLAWVAERFGGLPAADQVRARLSRADFLLYRNLLEIARSGDVDAEALEDYRRACAES